MSGDTCKAFVVVRKKDVGDVGTVRMVSLSEPHAAGGARRDLGDTVHHCTIHVEAPVDYATYKSEPPEPA